MADLEERLRSHSDAFSGLMSLIPAKYYYEEDRSDQWQRKKQTKEEAKNAKLAKLDPDAAKSAKDVMDENARKRKREENENEDGNENDDDDNHSESSVSELGSERPKEGLKRRDVKSKKQKQAETVTADEHNKASTQNTDAEERRKLKAEKKAEKKAAQRERKKAKDAAKMEKRKAAVEEQPKPTSEQASDDTAKKSSAQKTEKDTPVEEDNDDMDVVEGFSSEKALEETSSTSSTPDFSNFEMSNDNSGSSSISSIVPPSEAPQTTSKPALKPLKTTPDELRQRLQKRLDELRAARRADGLNGKPARTRQELIEARRLKAEERKRHKKELRRKAKEEEEKKRDEEMQRRFSPGGSGSLLASPRSPAAESLASSSNSNNFAFGRIAFPDGQHTDPTLSRLLDNKSKQGPRDPAAALKAAEAKKTRFSALDSEKRAELEEKDMWLNAKKRAHGERVRDDTSLLKKALKRKESAKKKSEREWRERIEGVAKGKEMRQQRRDENIRKRKEDHRGSGKKAGGGSNSKGGGKPKARPGFEGSFKAKSGAGGKNK